MKAVQYGIMSLVIIALFVVSKVSAENVTINNIISRRDTSGNIMDIHDGNVLLIDSTYYWYGASYGDCKEPNGTSGCDAEIGNCGFKQNHNVSLYTSKDLVTWTFQGHVFSALQYPQPSVMFCPKVVYNPTTKLYVLWTNWIGSSFSESYYAAAVSSSPYGPFKLVVNQIKTGYNTTGDFSLFVDNDGTGYVIYTAHITDFRVTHQMSIERLTTDFLGTLGLSSNSGFFGDSGVEAPTLFYANNLYYAIFGSCCCYCGEGSPVYVHTAENVLGPYNSGSTPISAEIPAQQTDVMTYNVAPGKYGYLWIGDRWQSAPDRIKGHDFVYFGQLRFNGTEIIPLAFESQFTLSIYVEN